MPVIEISNETDLRLQKIAKPLVDTYDTTIARLLDQSDALPAVVKHAPPAAIGAPLSDDGRVMEFDWRNPPSLSHTTLTLVRLNGDALVKADTYWNAVLLRVIEEAHQRGMTSDNLFKFLTVNKAKGEKVENGFKFAAGPKISFQGQTSDGAFRQIFELASKMEFELEVRFRWQPKEGAAHPNREGMFRI